MAIVSKVVAGADAPRAAAVSNLGTERIQKHSAVRWEASSSMGIGGEAAQATAPSSTKVGFVDDMRACVETPLAALCRETDYTQSRDGVRNLT